MIHDPAYDVVIGYSIQFKDKNRDLVSVGLKKATTGREEKAILRREEKATNCRIERATAKIVMYPLYLVRANTPRKEEHDTDHKQ